MSWSRRTAVFVLLACGGATVLFAWYAAAGFRVDSAVDRLLPANDPARAYYEGVRRELGNEEIIVVALFADDVFEPAELARIDTMVAALRRIEGVREVEALTTFRTSQLGADGLGKDRLMPSPYTRADIERFRQQATAHRLVQRTLVSPDSRAAGIVVRFRPMSDEEFLRLGIDERVRAAIAAGDGQAPPALTGMPTIKRQAAAGILRDLAIFVPLTTAGIAVVLVWAFGTVRGVLLPLAIVLMGYVWTAGVMGAIGTPFTLGTLVLPPLLLAVGVAYAIHVASRYYVEIESIRQPERAVTVAMRHVRMPVFMAALTTLIGFATFVGHPIPAIRDFGLFSAVGLTVIFVASLLALPAALTLLAPPAARPRPLRPDGWIARALDGTGRLARNHPWRIIAVWGAAMIISVLGIGRIRIETDYLRFFAPESAVRVENELVGTTLAGTQLFSVVIDGARPERATRLDTLNAMDALQRFVAAQPGVDAVTSLLDYLHTLRETIEPATAGQPFTDVRAVQELLLLLDPRDLERNLNRDHSRANLTVRTRLSESAEVRHFVQRVEAFGRETFPADVQVRVTGTVVLLNRSAVALAEGQYLGLRIVFPVLTAIMMLLFRSVRLGLLSMIPNVVPIVALFGAMGWLSIDLNIATSLIAVIAVGIAVDDTIHYLTTFRAELRAGYDRNQAIARTLRVVGHPILVTSVALCTGFLVPWFSAFQPIQHFGVLTSFTMAVALLADLLLLPALLTVTRVGPETKPQMVTDVHRSEKRRIRG